MFLNGFVQTERKTVCFTETFKSQRNVLRNDNPDSEYQEGKGERLVWFVKRTYKTRFVDLLNKILLFAGDVGSLICALEFFGIIEVAGMTENKTARMPSYMA